jgi:RNA polymerase sigma-70 factor (ECF subfamily)
MRPVHAGSRSKLYADRLPGTILQEPPHLSAASSRDPASLPDLESLMCGYQQADEAAARVFIERVSPVLLRYFLVQPLNRRFADDLMQETWMRIHKARHTWRRGEPVLPWIFAIARHTSLDSYRKSRRVETREIQVEVMPEPPASTSSGDTADLDTLLAALPASQREVVLLLKVSGLSVDEVARATASTAGAVRQKAHRAYRTLRTLLGRREKRVEA